MKPTPEQCLELTKTVLAAVKELRSPPETIALWEQAVRDCEAELGEKPE